MEYTTRTRSLTTAVVSSLFMAMFLSAAPRATALPAQSPPDRITIVDANLLEGFGNGDVRNMREIRVFADRVLKIVPRIPDVLLVQEVRKSSATYLAKVMTNKTGQRYAVAVNAYRRPYNEFPRKIVKADTAIVFNATTMAKVDRGGYITTVVDPRRGKTQYKKNARALLRVRNGTLSLAAASVHIPDQNLVNNTRKLARELQRKYPSTAPEQFEVLAGDFNEVPVDVLGQGHQRFTRYWTMMTSRFRYNDAVYNAVGRSGNDTIFVRRGIWNAGGDFGYNARAVKDDPSRFYSDHMFRWAMIGPDQNAPTNPQNVSGAARENEKGLRVRLVWDQSNDNETPTSFYFIYRSTDGQHYRKIGMYRDAIFYDYQVSGGNRYHYKVRASDYSWNKSGASQSFSVRVN